MRPALCLKWHQITAQNVPEIILISIIFLSVFRLFIKHGIVGSRKGSETLLRSIEQKEFQSISIDNILDLDRRQETDLKL